MVNNLGNDTKEIVKISTLDKINNYLSIFYYSFFFIFYGLLLYIIVSWFFSGFQGNIQGEDIYMFMFGLMFFGGFFMIPIFFLYFLIKLVKLFFYINSGGDIKEILIPYYGKFQGIRLLINACLIYFIQILCTIIYFIYIFPYIAFTPFGGYLGLS